MGATSGVVRAERLHKDWWKSEKEEAQVAGRTGESRA